MVSRKDFTYAEATTGALSCCAVCLTTAVNFSACTAEIALDLCPTRCILLT